MTNLVFKATTLRNNHMTGSIRLDSRSETQLANTADNKSKDQFNHSKAQIERVEGRDLKMLLTCYTSAVLVPQSLK